MLEAIGILVVFGIFGALMMTETMPTFIALGCMAIGIALVGGLSLSAISETVIVEGSTRLSSAMLAAIFGGALGVLMEKTGIIEDLVKSAAELGGDSPIVVSILLYTAVTIAATSLSGLGAYIMMATIVFPILVSTGVPNKLAAAIMLLANGTGVMLNPSNWVFYQEVTGISLQSVIIWALPTAAVSYIVGLIYIVSHIKGMSILPGIEAPEPQRAWAEGAGVSSNSESMVPTYALISPIVPIALVLAGVSVYTAFIIGLLFTAIVSQHGLGAIKQPKQTANLLTQSFQEGISRVAPALALMLTIGWLLVTVFSDPVSSTMEPLLSTIIPENMVMYAGVFILLAPLALYRGPLNLWGLGSGIIGVLAAIGINPQLITTTAVSALRIQAPGDPTNTHNAWTADELDVNVNEITMSILPFIWLVAAAGVVFSVILFW